MRCFALLCGMLLGLPALCAAQKTSLAYTDPRYFTAVPWGAVSQWAQPWRAYLDTVPARTFLDGIGIGLKVDNADPEIMARMLAEHGFTQYRMEENWNAQDWNDGLRHPDARHKAAILACKKYGLRPTVLVYSHQGAPCPTLFFDRKVAADAKKGDTKITLESAADLKPNYSGLNNLTDYWAAEAMIVAIEDRTITLSKPLPKEIKAGASIPMATLKYRPWSKPGTAEYKETMAGWLSNIDAIQKEVTELLGTQNAADKGFDLEIWNELTFGTKYLSINNYHAAKIYDYNEDSIWTNLVRETAAHIAAKGADWRGVQIEDGFGNTIPWTASAQEPPQVTAIGKHPYTGSGQTYPKDQRGGDYVNALLEKEAHPGFVPAYFACFPEYGGTSLQTETLIRDMAPLTTEIYGVKHGRNARSVAGKTAPCSVWFTECNIFPYEVDSKVTPEQAMRIKAKTAARYFCFYLNKGVTRIHLFATTPNDRSLGDREFGILPMRFIDYAEKKGAVYPAQPAGYAGPILTVTRRIVEKMRLKLDSKLTATRPLTALSVTDTHNHTVFQGDGTPAHPNLYDRDVFAFLPFQVNAKRFVIPYYVMTRNVMNGLAPEKFTVQIGGFAANAKFSAYDPFTDAAVPVRVRAQNKTGVTLELIATDSPFLLTVQE